MGSEFRFKRFSVCQAGPAMKVGTDGVLLGAWCSVERPMKRALDIGTGTGVIALMVAQRGEEFLTQVDAVEIDGDSSRQAAGNVAHSPWAGLVRVFHLPVQEFGAGCAESEKYDLIVSNPPYFVNSLQAPDPTRNIARHTVELPYGELTGSAARLLSPQGRFAVILPYEEAVRMEELLSSHGLRLRRRTDVHPTPSSGPRRSLMEFGRNASIEGFAHDELIIETAPLEYTESYRELTRDFYLKF